MIILYESGNIGLRNISVVSLVSSKYGHYITLKIVMTSFFLDLQGRVILEKLSPSVALSGRAIFYNALHRGYISQGDDWMICVLGNEPVQKGNIKQVKLIFHS